MLEEGDHRPNGATRIDRIRLGASFGSEPAFAGRAGERRRLTIAGVLAMRPEVLVMDEPFANLDYPGVKQILTHIVRLHRQGHTIVLAAHDLEKVGDLAQRIVIMSKGVRCCRRAHPGGAATGRAVRYPPPLRIALWKGPWHHGSADRLRVSL